MKLKSNLMFMILENRQSDNRYSKSFLNLQNVIELEESDQSFKLPKELLVKYNYLKSKYNKFLSDIPLIVIERYYNENKENMNKFVFLEFDNKELTDIKISELFLELEIFFTKIFNLTCILANYYNLEVKLNDGNTTEKYI